MNTIDNKSGEKIYLKSLDGHFSHHCSMSKKRLLVGSSDACDIILDSATISPVHAVIEIGTTRMRLFDMNSEHGTFLNGNKIVVDDFSEGDTISFGGAQFTISTIMNVASKDRSALPSKFVDHNEDVPVITEEKGSDSLPAVAVYPLAKEPNAEYSPYIFEDSDNLYPIFDYASVHDSVEVIILFKGLLYSIDYLPCVNKIYKLSGVRGRRNSIEYPYLPKKSVEDFIEVRNGEVLIHNLHGYTPFLIGDDDRQVDELMIMLGYDDVLQLKKGDLEFFIRRSSSPPKVKTAPIFRRDNEFKKYLALMLVIAFSFVSAVSMINVEKKDDKDKAPERIATILYKKRVKPKAERKLVMKPKPLKKVAKKSIKPNKIKVETPKIVSRSSKKVAKKLPGKKSAKKGLVKKAVPRKARVTNLKPKKVASGKVSKRKKSRSNGAKRRAAVNKKNVGHIDTFKSFDFSSSVKSILSKGGTTKAVRAATSDSSYGDSSSNFTGGTTSATLKRSKTKAIRGNLSGSVKGKLDTRRGLEGITSKKNIFLAGDTFREVIVGNMDPNIIRKILMDNLDKFRFCYQKELDRMYGKRGGIAVLEFVIGASGHVGSASASLKSSSMPGSVSSCLVRVLKGIPFPEPLGGGIVEVKQPMNFFPRRM